MKVTVYTKGGCPFCVKAKRLLTNEGIAFREVNLEHQERDVVDALIAKTNYRKVPQIFIGGEFIGGFTELEAKHMNGELNDLKPID
jgi:glutaredoxin 3